MLSALLVVSVALLAGAQLIHSDLKKRSEDIVKKRAEVIKIEKEQKSLVQARKNIQTYKPLAEIAKDIVPQDKNQAQTAREIVKIANDNKISLGSITFPTSNLGDAPVKGGSSSTPAATKPDLSQLTPVKGIPGVYSLQIAVTSNTKQPVTYDALLSFLHDLEHNRRTALVSDISINPDKANPNAISFTLTLDEYIKP